MGFYTLDTEFFEDGREKPVKLISLGMVSDTGKEYYAEVSTFDWRDVPMNHWIQHNVRPHLVNRSHVVKPYAVIREEILKFIGNDPAPEFWGYFADYDWVLFAQIFGRMVDLPRHFPQLCLDIKQLMMEYGIKKEMLPQQGGQEHHALEDARWEMDALKALKLYRQKTLDRLSLNPL